MSPSDKSDRDAILGRRRLFVASAMASIAVTQTRCESPFRPCLEPAIRADAEPTACLSPPPQTPDASVSIATDAGEDAGAAPLQPCLSVALPPPDAGKEAGRDAGAKMPPKPPPPPQVCLSPVRPQPCLKPAGGGLE